MDFTTFEGLIQRGVELFKEQASNIHNGVRMTFSGACIDDSEDDGSEDWFMLLNLAISRLARMDCDICQTMRQSVPRHEGWKQVYTQRFQAKAGKGLDASVSFDEALKQDYESMINTLVAETTAEGLRSFLQPYDESEFAPSYTFAGQPDDFEADVLGCYLEAEIDEEIFMSIVKQFATFALENRQAVLEHFEMKERESMDSFEADDEEWMQENWSHTRHCNNKYPLALRFANQSVDCAED